MNQLDETNDEIHSSLAATTHYPRDSSVIDGYPANLTGFRLCGASAHCNLAVRPSPGVGQAKGHYFLA
jgi:hypothetical protein